MSNVITKRILAAAVAGAVFGSSAAVAEEVNVYSARHYDSDEALYSAFTEETGIEVNVIEGDSDQLIERIKREGVASPADIMMTVDAGRLWRAEQEGIFQGIESDVLAERLPESMQHPEGMWFGFSQRVRVIYYNRETVNPVEIETYMDLTDPKWEGEICIRSSSNIYNQSLMASMIEHHGEDGAEEWAEGIVANMARQPQGGDTDQIRGVAAGECDLAVGNHYYYVRLLKSDDLEDREQARRVGIIFPNQEGDGAHVNVGGAGVVANAPNRDNAIRFLEFLASDTAQEAFAQGNNEFPVIDSVKWEPVLESFGNFNRDDLNISVLGENNPAAVRIFDRAGWR